MADERAGADRRAEPGKNARRPRADHRIREWQFAAPVVVARAVLLLVFLHPLMAIFSRRRAFGREWLDSIDGPVIFAANHLSVADNPAVLLALPWRWRLRVATAAGEEVLRGRGRVQAFFAALISNGFFFSQTGSVRASLAYCGRLTGAGVVAAVLSRRGALRRWRAGAVQARYWLAGDAVGRSGRSGAYQRH